MDHKGCIKSFSWYSRSWYGKMKISEMNFVDNLTIGFYHEEGGTSGEFSIQWDYLLNNIVPQLKAFDDGWNALANMPELLEYLASVDDQHTTIDVFVDNLLRLGFADRTAKKPNGE